MNNLVMFDEDVVRATERMLDATGVMPYRDADWISTKLARFGREVPLRYLEEAQRRRVLRYGASR